MSFKLAQTFYIDKTTVRNAEQVTLTSIDLYFKSKPRQDSNRSGIYKPGVSLALLQTKDDDTPDIDKPIDTAFSTNEYDSVVATTDASIATKFSFSEPVIIKTNRSYALAIICDGDEDYELWTCVEGDNIVGTNTTSPGAVANFVGKYYEFSSPVNNDNTTGTTQEQWKPLNDTDLKFTVYVAKYDANTVSQSISKTYILPADPVEYIVFDRYNSNTANWQDIIHNEFVYQETPVIYGTINVDANSVTITCTNNINFSTLIDSSDSDDIRIANTSPSIAQKSYIVLRNGTTQASNVDIREVTSIVSNTQLTIDKLPSFTNNAASFSVTAVGRVVDVNAHWYSGRWWDANTNTMDTLSGKRTDILKLLDSNANSSVRFVNNMVESIAITGGGSGYSNADVVTVYPMTNANTANADHINYIGTYSNATANVVTDGSGTITGIAITNPGYGLVGNAAVSIATSGGTSATLTPTIGSKLKAATSNVVFANTVVANIPTNRIYPNLDIDSNQHHDYNIYQHFMYYTLPGTEHILNQQTPGVKKEFDPYTQTDLNDFISADNRSYVIASRSNEVAMTNNVTIQVANGSNLALDIKTSSAVEVSITSNNVYTLPLVKTDSVYNYRYIINNDSTNEHKSYGNALAKHISEKITFVENRKAEDIVVYLTAWKPVGTDLKVYARLHDDADSDAFDDKDWTELSLRSGNASEYSNINDKNDLIELSFGLPTTPPSVNTISGSITLASGNTEVNGLSTDFSTDLSAGDVIKLYPELFPDNYMITTVDSVTNVDHIVIKDPVTDSDLYGGPAKMDFIGRSGSTEIGRPHSAWINRPNSYICRYYDSNLGKHDGYSTFAVKIVYLSNNGSVIPEVENSRGVGVSA